MVDYLQALLDFIIAFIGLTTMVLLYWSKNKLSKGLLYNLLNSLFYSVIFFGVPYTVVNFLVSAGVISILDQRFVELASRVLIAFFFISMLRAAFFAKQLADTFGFKHFFKAQAPVPHSRTVPRISQREIAQESKKK